MIKQNIFTIKIGGMAGQGIKSAGLMFAKLAKRSGYNIYTYTEYPSLIRGGHNVMQINISHNEVSSPVKKTNLLIALNQETIEKHLDELVEGGGIIFDEGAIIDTSKTEKDIDLCPMPLAKLAEGKELLVNTVALGAAAACLGADLSILKNLINEEFSDKGGEIVEMNNKAADAGYNFIREHFGNKLKEVIKPIEKNGEKMIVNGNEAVALGAIAGGLQFASIYPMSPISNILHVLSLYQEKYGYIYKQPEDEISAINMAIGASFAGVRSMTATSGGGFSLMVEGYGLAAMMETPLVVIYGMRPGPATGLATWSGQGDLQFALHAHQGDFPRIVLSAGDAKEAYELTMQAFNLADKYQTPVILLIDKNICENDQSFPIFDTASYQIDRGKLTLEKTDNYKRYAVESDGVSARTIPGKGNFFIGNSYEHTQEGFESEDIEDINNQMKKRMEKFATCEKEDMQAPILFGPSDADVTIVSWGSNKGSILDAMKNFDNVNFLHITWISPFPTDFVKNTLTKSKYVVDIECNCTAQMANLIKEKTGIEILDKMLKYDGRPFFAEEIINKINSILKK